MARDYVRKNNKRSSRSYEEEGGHNWRWPLAGILVALFVAGIFYLKQQSDKLAAAQGNQGGIIQQTMKQDIPESAPRSTPANNKTSTKAEKNTGKTHTAETPTSPPPQPKFDFYTMLPQGQQSANNAAKPTTPPPAATQTMSTAPATVTPQQAAPVTTPAAPIKPAPTTTETSKPVVTTQPKAAQAPNKKQLEKNAQADTSDLIAMEIKKLNEDKSTTTKVESNNTKNNKHYVVQLGVFKNYSDADQFKAQLTLQGLDVTIKGHKKQNTTLYHVFMGPYPSLAAAKKQQHLLEENQIKSKIAKE